MSLEQMSLFDFTDLLSETGVKANSKKLSETSLSETDYLQRGEKILTLLRNKQHKQFKQFVISGLFETVNIKTYQSKNDNYSKFDYLLSCAKKVLSNRWKLASASEDFTSFFNEVGIKDVIVSKTESNDGAGRILKELTKKNVNAFEGCVKLQTGNDIIYAPLGKTTLTKRRSGRSWHFRGSNISYKVCDVSLYFAECYLLNCFRKRIQHELADLTDEQLNDNLLADYLHSTMDSTICQHKSEYGLIKFNKGVIDIPFVHDFILEHGIPVEEVEKSGIGRPYLLPLWFMSDEPYNYAFIYGMKPFIVKLFDLLYEVYSGDKMTDEFIKSVATEYAKVYQTKKAIPDKVIKAMSKSGFNDFFGYVEFDEECDLKKMAEIEKEFRVLQKVIFHQQEKREDVSIRFRKLGRHKASGLYFPTLKCLCVDVRCPSSMAHEYGHMLDYENGGVSKGVKFSMVRIIYKELLEEYISILPKDDPLRLRWYGYTKYNKAYYLEPTEVYARSLEIYLVRSRHIDNSLVKPDEGFAYPDDERLNNAIAAYFDGFFGVSTADKVAVSI